MRNKDSLWSNRLSSPQERSAREDWSISRGLYRKFWVLAFSFACVRGLASYTNVLCISGCAHTSNSHPILEIPCSTWFPPSICQGPSRKKKPYMVKHFLHLSLFWTFHISRKIVDCFPWIYLGVGSSSYFSVSFFLELMNNFTPLTRTPRMQGYFRPNDTHTWYERTLPGLKNASLFINMVPTRRYYPLFNGHRKTVWGDLQSTLQEVLLASNCCV